MKKYGLLKVIGIMFLCYVVLTWIIPSGAYSGGEFTKGTTDPVGLYGLFRDPLVTFLNFFQMGIIFLIIGGLYGVMNKTGVYSKMVNKVFDKFKNRKTLFVVLTIIFYAVLASLTSLTTALFVVVPFSIAVLLLLGYSKLTALASTVLAMLVGNLASTYGSGIIYYTNYYLANGINDNIIVKVILLVLAVILLAGFVLFTDKLPKDKKAKVSKTTKESKKTKTTKTVKDSSEEDSKDIPLYDGKVSSKRSFVPLLILFFLTIVILLVSMYNWSSMFKIEFFTDIYESLMGVKIGDYPIFANIIDSINPMGYWSSTELSVVLVILSLIIGWVYNLKLGEIIDSFIDGAKEMFGVAIYAILASVIFMSINILANQSGQFILYTLANGVLGLASGINALTTTIVAAIGSLFLNDYYYFVTILTNVIPTDTLSNAGTTSLIAFIFQTIHGFMMLILPVSVILIAGLAYMKVSFKEWFKYIWKFLLALLVVIVIAITVLALI